MKTEELEAIRKRAEAATMGDWDYDVVDFGISNGNFMVAMAELDSEGNPYIHAKTADLEFICEAREDVPNLLAEVIRLRILAGMLNERLKSDGETLVWEFSGTIDEDLAKNEARYEKIKKVITGVDDDGTDL
jgi:hypothetical protein